MSLVEIIVSRNNSNTTPLTANETFIGTVDDLSSFQEITVTIAGTPNTNAPGILFFEFSTDGTHWDISVPIALDAPALTPLTLRVILPNFRIKYINGGTPLTEFRLTTVLHRSGAKQLTRFLNQYIKYDEPVENVRAILTGQTPDGYFELMQVDQDGYLTLSSNSVTKITDGINTVGITDVTGQKALKVDVIQSVSGGGGGGTASNFATTFPATGTAIGFIDSTSAMQGARVFDLNTGAGTDNVLGTVLKTSSGAGAIDFGTVSAPIKIDPVGTTSQPVSGTVTANAGTGTFTISGTVTSNIGTTGGLALDSTLTGGTAKFEIYDGTNILGTTLHPVRTDPTGTTTQPISGTVTANAGTGTFTVSGTIAATQSGTWTVQPGNTANTTPWLTTINQGGNSATVTATNALKVDGSGVTQPVSGTITSNQGTANSVANSWPIKVSDGTDTVGISTVGAAKALKVDVIQSVGGGSGGTSSNFGSTFPVAGTASGFTDGTNMQAATVFDADTGVGTQYILGINLRKSASGGSVDFGTNTDPIRIDPTGTTTQPISGTVTANAGTGNFTVVQATASNLNAQVTGTVTANIGTTNGLAFDTTLAKLTISQGTALGSNTQALMGGSVTTAAPTYTTGNINPLSLTTGGLLRVDGSAVTQPVSGTVTANAGSGTFTVSGTVTSNIGTTNGLALDTSVNGILVSQGSTTSGEKGPLIQGAVTTAAPTYITAQTSPLSLTTSGALRVDGSAVTQPVSGAVTANAGTGTFAVSGTVSATQSGTWTVQPGNTANTTPWLTTISQGGNSAAVTVSNALKIDGSAVTQPVSGTVTSNIGTTGGLALDTTFTGGTAKFEIYDGTNVLGTTLHPVRIDPTGTTTQPISGTITANAGTGTFTVSGTVTANIGTTNGLALDTSVTGLQVSQGSTTSGQKGGLIQGAVTTAAPTYTTAQTSPLSLTTTGALRVDGSGVTQPVSGTVTANAGSGTFTVSGTVTSNIGTTNGLALDTTLSKLTVAQGAALGSNTQILNGGSVTTAAPTYITGQISPLSLTTGGGLRVDGSGVTQPISGTITANQGGTWTIQPGNTANTTPWLTTINQGGNSATVSAGGALKVDGSAVTQPVSGTVTANAGTGTFTTKETRSSATTVTSVAASATNVTLLASNANRLGATIINDSTTATLYVKLGATSSTSSYTVQLLPTGYYEVPYNYTGIIDGIWGAAVGNARITECT